MLNLLLFLLIGTFSPGPNNLISMHLAIQTDMSTVSKYIAGTFWGFLIVLNLTGFGHYALSNQFPHFTIILKYIGFGFLLYLAIKIFKESGPISDDNNSVVSWKYGFTLQFVNIKIWLVGLTVFSVYIFEYSRLPYIIFLTALVMSIIGVISQYTWALLGLRLKKYYNMHYRVINGIMSATLVYLAVSMLH